MKKRQLSSFALRSLNPLLPFIRVGQQVRESAGRIAELRRDVAARRRRAAVNIQAPDVPIGADAAQVAALKGRALFEAHVTANGWTEEELDRQLAVVRVTRFGSILGLGVTAVLVFFAVHSVPLALLPFVLVVLGLGLGMQLLITGRNAQWQVELEERRLYTASEFLGRPDLFRRLFLIRLSKD